MLHSELETHQGKLAAAQTTLSDLESRVRTADTTALGKDATVLNKKYTAVLNKAAKVSQKIND